MWKRLPILWTVVRGDARRVWGALRDPASPSWFRWGIAGVVLYLFSPIDLVPEFIPFFGVMDDLVLVPMAIRWLLNRLPPEIASRR